MTAYRTPRLMQTKQVIVVAPIVFSQCSTPPGFGMMSSLELERNICQMKLMRGKQILLEDKQHGNHTAWRLKENSWANLSLLLIINLTLSRGGPELTVQGGGGKNACATYFGHISSTEARIFMKFETYVHKIVLNHQPNFHKDPCKDARARGENARTCDAL